MVSIPGGSFNMGDLGGDGDQLGVGTGGEVVVQRLENPYRPHGVDFEGFSPGFIVHLLNALCGWLRAHDASVVDHQVQSAP